MLLSDFNAHLPNPSDDSVTGNQKGKLLSDIFQNDSLFVASNANLSNGPNYTFFSSANRTTVNYIITDASLASTVCECHVHSHHPLNLSDHLPITNYLYSLVTFLNLLLHPEQKSTGLSP